MASVVSISPAIEAAFCNAVLISNEILAGLGDKDAAFDWLTRAYNDRSYILVVHFNTDARLDSLRNDPRFEELRRKINLPEPK
jgi:hypothetical protein